MKEFSELSLFELAEIMRALQSGEMELSSEDRGRLLDEIESRVQRRKQSHGGGEKPWTPKLFFALD